MPDARGEGVHAIVRMTGMPRPCDSLVSSDVTESLSRGGLSALMLTDCISRGRETREPTLIRLCSESLRPTVWDVPLDLGKLAVLVNGLCRNERSDENRLHGERASPLLPSRRAPREKSD